jgi:uncharacterized membrane protein YjdF
MNLHARIATVASVLIVLLAVVAQVPTYRVAPAFLIPLLWLPYVLRHRLPLHPVHYALFAIAILLHGLGAFGFYQRSFFGLSFDIYVHFYFAIPVALVLERFFRRAMPGRPWAARVAALMFMMGFGALHEIMEYVSYLMLGEARGMLKPSTSYPFDTQRDLVNNLLGTLTALALSAASRVARAVPPRDELQPPVTEEP